MSEPGEKIEAFVSADSIKAELEPSVLDGQELDAAVAAIQHTRARWVVDNIAAELGNRAVLLREEQAVHENRISEIITDLAFIKDTLRLPDSPTEDALPAQVQQRREQYTKKLGYYKWLEALSAEPSFTLYLPPFGLEGYDRYPELVLWVEDHKTELLDTYGSTIKRQIVRTAFNLDNTLLDYHHLSTEASSESIPGSSLVVDPDQEGGRILSVEDTRSFFGSLMENDWFSYKSAIALLCVADFQTEQRQAHA